MLFRICAVILCAVTSKAGDWPRLGGPEATWVSLESPLARSWPTNGPPTLWTVNVGEGFAGPSVYEGSVYLEDRQANQQDILRCFSLATGEEEWRLAFDAPGTLPYNGSRNVPTVNKDYIFCVGPFGQLRCVSREKHELIWNHNLIDEFKDSEYDLREPRNREESLARAQVPTWGFTQAPLLYRDLVIAAPQTRSTGMVAYEQSTGKLRWKSGYIGRNWYSHMSPYLTTLCGVEQVIMLAQPSDPEKSPDDAPPAIISSISPSTGKILWTNQTPAPDKIPIAEPVRIGTNRLFITGGYGLGCFALEVTHSNGNWETRILFHNRTVAGHIHSPVFYKGRIYETSFKEHRGTHTGLVCVEPDGRPVWQTGPDLQFESGPFLIADGMVFILNGRTGELNLFDITDDQPRLLSKAKVLDAKDGKAWAPMALSNGKLLLRDQHQLKCLDVASTKEKIAPVR